MNGNKDATTCEWDQHKAAHLITLCAALQLAPTLRTPSSPRSQTSTVHALYNANCTGKPDKPDRSLFASEDDGSSLHRYIAE